MRTLRPTGAGRIGTLIIGVAFAISGCGVATSAAQPQPTGAAGATLPAAPAGAGAGAGDIHVIRHVVMIMQENRSFDTYFGTYPGATGIPMAAGRPAVCVPDPATGGCDQPFHTTADRQTGGPHNVANAQADINSGAGHSKSTAGASSTEAS